MKRKIIALLLCIVCVVSLCFPVAADDDGYSAIVSDIDKTCPTCGATLHASWGSTSGAEVELEISDTGKVKIPAGAGAFARIHLRCSSCGYEKTETRLLGLDFGAEKPGKLVQAPSGIGRKDLPGYSDNNVPDVSQSGQLHFYAPVTCWGITGSSNYYWISSGTPELVRYNTKDCEGSSFSSESEYSSCVARAICAFTAPVSGTYYIYKDSLVADYYWRFSSSDDWKKQSLSFKATKSASFNKGEDGYVSVSTSVSVPIGFNAKGYGVDISRLDIACDTFGKLKLKTVQGYTRAGRYISRWKTFLIQEGSAEMAVIWGSSKSDFRLRIYDKTLERQVKGSVDADKIPKDWVRCEFQLRNDAAASFIRSWQSNGSIGLTFMGIMKNQLLYVSQYDGKNRDRATVAPWWARLLGDAEQIRMAYDAGKDYNFDSLKRYIFHQAGSSIKAYLAIMDGDFGPLLQGVRMAALNDRQTELIRSAQEQRREWQQRQIEYNKM